MGERTYRATRRAIDYREAVPVFAKGKADPVPVWEAIASRLRFGVDLAQPTPVPLVGRQRELELLISTLARVIEEQTAQLVTLIGVPGMGKTRLVGELLSSVEAGRDVITWRQGRSLPYGDGVTFWALGEIVKAQAGILENDAPAIAEARLRETVDLLGADAAERRWLAAGLRPLVGLEDATSGARGEDRFAAWRRFLEALAAQRPLVLVFEDLHWADGDLLEFVDGLVDHVSGVPMLVLATARPELLDRRPAWGGGKGNAATVSLAPLTGEACEQLVTELLTREPIPRDSRERLLARIGGNPLYAEQYVRAFLERGAISDLPDTIQGIIAARLDGLPPLEKAALQDAAVIGKLFWLGALLAIGSAGRDELAHTLHWLERMQFVQRARRSSVAGEEEYAFRHVLIRDVAYGQIPRAHRGHLHLAAIEWLESTGRPDDLAETLAHHYTAALELLPAADIDPRLASRARTAFREAGERALSLSAYPAAVRYFQAAFDLLSDPDPERARVLLGLGRARFGADGSGDRELGEALGEARSTGDSEIAAEAALALRVDAWYRGDSAEADRWLQMAFDVLGDLPDSRAKAHALSELFRSNNASGNREDTIRRGPDALALVERVGPDSIHSRILNSIGTSRVHLGDPGGMDDIRLGIDIARAAGALEQVHAGMNNLSATQLFYGDLAAAVQTYEELVEMVERVGREVDRRWARISLAGLRLTQGRWDDAAELANSFVDESESGAPHYLDGVAYSIRAQIRLARDDIEGASTDADHALQRGRDTDVQVLTAALVPRAAMLLDVGHASAARAVLDELLTHGAHIVPTEHEVVDLAWTAYDLDRAPALREVLASSTPVPWVRAALLIADGAAADAAVLLTQLGYRPGAAYANLRAAEQAAGARPADARAHLESAIAIYTDLKATRFLRRAQTTRT